MNQIKSVYKKHALKVGHQIGVTTVVQLLAMEAVSKDSLSRTAKWTMDARDGVQETTALAVSQLMDMKYHLYQYQKMTHYVCMMHA